MQDLDINNPMSHKVSQSMFDENGNVTDAKTKSHLKNALKVEVSRRLPEQWVQATFLNGFVVLWVVPWPTSGTIFDYLARSRSYLQLPVQSLSEM